jgi:hypothetical protein
MEFPARLEDGESVPNLSIVSAKDYVPGKEYEIIEAVQALLFASMHLLKENLPTEEIADAFNQATGWFWNSEKDEEKKCDQDIYTRRSGDWTPGELDGIMDSMNYVLEVMGNYQSQVKKAAAQYLPENLERQDDDVSLGVGADKEGLWSVKDVALDETSPADLLLGSFMPNQSADVYPKGSQPIKTAMPSCGPTTDMFIGSIASLLGGISEKSGDSHLNSKLRYLINIESVKEACTSQIHELDSILKMDSRMDHSTNNSVLTEEKWARAHQQEGMSDASSYLRAARGKLSEYASLADSILKDEVKCLVSEYTCAPKCGDHRCGDQTDNRDGLYFEALRKHFRSDAYKIDFKTYLNTEADDAMEKMLLNTLHSSLFLRNVGDKCGARIRVHIGTELSICICNLVMDSIMFGREKRVTEWGALLFHRHVRALHAYVYEFCRCKGDTKDLLSKIGSSSLNAPPMDDDWKKLFSVLNILKLERLSEFRGDMLDPSFSAVDARRILSLRTDFSDEAIDAALLVKIT